MAVTTPPGVPPDSDPGAPPAPWYRTYWVYYNRPYGGCGCLYLFALLFLMYWLLSLVFFPGRWLWW